MNHETFLFLLLGFIVGWALRRAYEVKFCPPRSVIVDTHESLHARTIGRMDPKHAWQQDGGLWEAHTVEAKAEARRRAENLFAIGIHPPRPRLIDRVWRIVF
jgi:hypothetical protein